ncbi:MAG TPA: hypothetical protein PLN07_00630 [Myxococcota bacterium]|jgi:hypothetical protein|nr:hypothetical protein [Myxococcota bacterium]
MQRKALLVGLVAVSLIITVACGGEGAQDVAKDDLEVVGSTAEDEGVSSVKTNVQDVLDVDDVSLDLVENGPEVDAVKADDAVTEEVPADDVLPDATAECPSPLLSWDDIVVPDDPTDGIREGPPTNKVCMERMPDSAFEGLCGSWAPPDFNLPEGYDDRDVVEDVLVEYDPQSSRLKFFWIDPQGFEIRSDGVGIKWLQLDSGEGWLDRLEFSLDRIRLLSFDIRTGKVKSDVVLVPLCN